MTVCYNKYICDMNYNSFFTCSYSIYLWNTIYQGMNSFIKHNPRLCEAIVNAYYVFAGSSRTLPMSLAISFWLMLSHRGGYIERVDSVNTLVVEWFEYEATAYSQEDIYIMYIL